MPIAVFRPLRGLRVLSLGLNVPVPVALQRARRLGARVRKIEPPAGDPLLLYAPRAYAELHAGVPCRRLDLRSPTGQRQLQRALGQTDVLLTSFRPRALQALGLDGSSLRAAHPGLWVIQVVGSEAQPEDAGHDLTYQAAQGLLRGAALPPTLWADLAGAEAVLRGLHQAALGRLQAPQQGRCLRIGLEESLAQFTAPRAWGLTREGDLLGGAHAGYRVYACRDGHVALAALEPKFVDTLVRCAGLADLRLRVGRRAVEARSALLSVQPHPKALHEALGAWFASRTRAQWAALAAQEDLPLVVFPEP